MSESKPHKLLSTKKFLIKLLNHGVVTLLVIAFSLLIGIFGYHYIAGLGWIDSFLNASMILGGMGPVDPLTSDSAKIFAGLYALYSGLVLLISVGILASPLMHRLMHKIHLSTKD